MSQNENDILSLPFDLYTRNKLINNLVDILRAGGGFEILDVGGRNGDLIKFLHKRNKLYIIDIRRSEQQEKNYIVGNIKKAPFEDDSFDVVISSDLYEHINPSDRIISLSEMLRISKNYIILGGPFYSEENEEAENRANNFFLEITERQHPWLEEHIKTNLPKKDELERYLIEEGYDFFVVTTNNILNWYLLQCFIFYSYKYGPPADKIKAVYRFYNENFIELGDLIEPTYRRIYIIGKKGSLPINKLQAMINFSTRFDIIKYQKLVSLLFDCLRAIPESKDTHIKNLEYQISKIGFKMESLDQAVSERDERITAIGEELQKEKERAEALATTISNRDGKIAAIKEELRRERERAEDLAIKISEQNERVQGLEKDIFDMRRSIVWQLLMNYHNWLVERRMPLGTRRRRCYDLWLEGGRILVNEGLKSLSFRVRWKMSSKIPFLKENLNTPLFETNRLGSSSCVPLPLDEVLSGEFIFPTEGLNEVRIFTASYRRRNSDLTLRLKGSPKGPVIREAKVKGQAIKDNDYTPFRFKPVKEIPEEMIFFELKSEGEPHAAVWYDPASKFKELRLYRSGREIEGQIGLQAFSSLKVWDRYHLWRLKNEPSQRELEVLKKRALSLKYRPKISIITPVWNTEERWLRRAIESVLGQVYDNWELCIAEGRSERPHVRDVLEEYEAANPRILVRFLSENRGIAGNSNEALSMATGDFVAFLDHDDELAPFALYEVVKLLNENPNLDYVYSDEDKIDETGARHDPFFKPDWSPDMFLSCNYLCHLSMIRKRLVDEVGGFRSEYDGSQDYDLFLRVTERIGEDGIGHIPKILYHWRTAQESTASSCEAKSYAYQGAIKALEDAMMRREIRIEKISVGVCLGVDYRIKYKIIDEPKISIIIPTRDNVNTLRKCVNSIIAKTLYDNYEIILIDNQSVNEETFNYYTTLDSSFIKILHFDEVFNYSKMNNFAVSNSSSEFLVFLNNDVEIISERWIVAMLEHAQRRTVGAVGAKLLYPNGSIQHAGVIIGLGGVAGHAHKCFPANNPGYFCRIQMVQNFSAVTAACMMTKKSLFEEVGGFDEKNLAIAFNDIDYCLKLRQKGYRIVYTPYAELYHHESLSRGYEDTPEKQKRFQEEVSFMRNKWGDLLDKDPYYNQNLTREREDFSIRIRHNLF